MIIEANVHLKMGNDDITRDSDGHLNFATSKGEANIILFVIGYKTITENCKW